MDKETLVNLIINYDFINNSMRKFAKEQGIHYNTVSKYIKEFGVPYNPKNTIISRPRLPNGNFTFHNVNKNKLKEPTNTKHEEVPLSKNSQNKKIVEKKEKKTIRKKSENDDEYYKKLKNISMSKF